MKSKTAAALWAFFLGGLGAHKFYLGRPGMGLVYMLFCWTGIPSLIAFFEFFGLVLMSEQAFNAAYNNVALGGTGAAVTQSQNIVVNIDPAKMAGASASLTEQIREIHDLHVAGILTDSEFAAKKADLLAGAGSLPQHM